METTGYIYLSNDMYLIWVYYFVSMLMMSCFVGAMPTFGCKRITKMEPDALGSDEL